MSSSQSGVRVRVYHHRGRVRVCHHRGGRVCHHRGGVRVLHVCHHRGGVRVIIHVYTSSQRWGKMWAEDITVVLICGSGEKSTT